MLALRDLETSLRPHPRKFPCGDETDTVGMGFGERLSIGGDIEGKGETLFIGEIMGKNTGEGLNPGWGDPDWDPIIGGLGWRNMGNGCIIGMG